MVAILKTSLSDAFFWPWWRHQMEIFSASLAICAGNSPVPGEFPTQRPVTRSFDVFFDLRLNKQLSKQSWGWWFETLSGSLWRQCNAEKSYIFIKKSLTFVPISSIYNKSAMVQVMAWCHVGTKPLTEPMMIQFTMTWSCGVNSFWSLH